MRIFRMFGAATLIVALLVACGGPIKTAVSVTGTLSINISGLPAGVDGSIFVFGNNFGAHVTESQILDELLPGSYSVLPVDVTVGEQRFVAPEGSVVVEQDAESEFVVAYQLAETQTPTTGSLELQITGLPAEVDGSIYVFGDGFGAHVTESQILGDLLLGRYSVLPVDVMVGEQRFIAPEGSVVVEQDAESEFVVAYQLAETQTPTTGSLEIQITGLPDGILADVGVTHPGGFNTQITAGIDFPALLPGSYSIQANPVQAGFDTYIATGGAECG